MYSDDEPPANPDYKEELDLTLSNASMRDVMDTLGYTTDLENPHRLIDESIARTTPMVAKEHSKVILK